MNYEDDSEVRNIGIINRCTVSVCTPKKRQSELEAGIYYSLKPSAHCLNATYTTGVAGMI